MELRSCVRQPCRRLRRSLAVAIVLVLTWGAAAPAAQPVELGPIEIVPEPDPGLPGYRFCPDGHISFLRDGDRFQMYWPGSTTYRTRGRSVMAMATAQPVLEAGLPGSFENGGAWLNSVFRRSGNKLVGFYHAEDHEFEGDPQSQYVAWKSIACCLSSDNGLSWQKEGQILTSSRPKPRQPSWGGCGDFCVVRDEKHARWLCFFQQHALCIACSEDPLGKPGTWRKYYRGDFREPGLGGRSSPIAGLVDHAGGNPSVHFNTYLQRWVMVWGTWERTSPRPESIWLSTSDDLLKWSAPQVLVAARGEERCWYPTIIGDSDVSAGQKALLCYAYFPDKTKAHREFVAREITFHKQRRDPPPADRSPQN